MTKMYFCVEWPVTDGQRDREDAQAVMLMLEAEGCEAAADISIPYYMMTESHRRTEQCLYTTLEAPEELRDRILSLIHVLTPDANVIHLNFTEEEYTERLAWHMKEKETRKNEQKLKDEKDVHRVW